MKWNIKGKLIGILGIMLITGTLVTSIGTSLNQEEIISYKENEELKALTLNKFYNHKKETQEIIDKHKNDFTYKNVKTVLKSKGGYVKYVESLGGVFKKYINNGKPVKIQTYSELAEVADYVWGLYDIWGVDYSNGCGYQAKHQYNYDNGGASRFYPDSKNPGGRYNVNYSCYGFANKSLPGVDEMLANPDKYYAVTNCDMGVCQLFKKAGLISSNMPGPGTYPATYKSNGYTYKIIRNPKDFMPGDVILVMSNNNVNVSGIKEVPNWQKDLFHTIVVGERNDKAGTITYFDSGHKYTRKGTYRSIRALGDNKVYTSHTKWIALRYNFTEKLKDDKTPPKLTVEYGKAPTNKNVIVSIKANEKIKAVSGWTLSSDQKILKKEYSQNTKSKVTVTVEDLVGNKSSVTFTITNIDKTKPKLSVTYSNKEPTNNDVLVTIKSNEKMRAKEGWKLSADQMSLSKSYSSNATENIAVYDLAGNEATTKVEINNIDKVPPKLELNFSTTELTNKGVIVTIKSDKKIKDVPEGWTLANDGMTFSKEFSKNSKEKFEVTDIIGNKASVEFEINNIYETKLETTKYSVDEDMIIVKQIGETVEKFKENNTMTAKSIKILNKNGIEMKDTDVIGTGCKIVLDDTLTYRIVVLGDYDGDGKISVKEIAQAQKIMLQSINLDDINIRSLDFNENGRIDVSDLASICKTVMEQQ